MFDIIYFFLGVLTTTAIIAILNKYNKRSKAKRPIVRQSSVFLMVKILMPEMIDFYNDKYTQTLSYENNKTFKFIEMPDNRAYWIDRNKIYYAELNGGKFSIVKGKPLPMNNLSEDQVSKVLFIFNSLQNG